MTHDLTTADTYAERGKVYCGEWLGPSVLGSKRTGFITMSIGCGYPFDQDGLCINRANHQDPLACLGSPTHPEYARP